MTRTVAPFVLAGATGLALLAAASHEAKAACRTVTARTSAPTSALAAIGARREATDRAGRLASRFSASRSGVPSRTAGVGRVVTTCRGGDRTRCTASVVVCP